MQHSGVLGAYASGRVSALVVDIGDGSPHSRIFSLHARRLTFPSGTTTITPIKSGYLQECVDYRLDIAGCDITQEYSRLMTKQGCYFETTAEREVAR